MASIEARQTKNGYSYHITIDRGRDANGNRIRDRIVFKPEPGMTKRQADKAAQRYAMEYEQRIENGYILNDSRTFAEYAQYVLELKLENNLRIRTYERYQDLLRRILPHIGHLKLTEIRAYHLNLLYSALRQPKLRDKDGSATANIDMAALLKANHLSRAEVSRRSGVSPVTVGTAVQGKTISASNAKLIAQALDMELEDIFTIRKDERKLADKTVLEYHRLIHTILAQADKEMLVPYNAADKATAPKVGKTTPNYFQPSVIHQILDVLKNVSLRWRALVHFLIVTGCRRGEAVGLRWSKIDWKNNTVRIDRALVESEENGLYEDDTKTSDRRTLKLPQETMDLLRELREEQRHWRLQYGDSWGNSGYVFCREDGTPTRPATVTSWLRDFSVKYDLPHINPHAFRHTLASVLLSEGIDIVTVSKYLGHANVTTTETIYAHIIEENMTKAAECIGDVMLR